MVNRNALPGVKTVASHKGGFIGKSGKSVNYIIFDDFLDFALYESWEVLDRCKILVQAPLRISTPGKPNSGNFFSDFSDPLSSIFPAEPTDRGANG